MQQVLTIQAKIYLKMLKRFIQKVSTHFKQTRKVVPIQKRTDLLTLSFVLAWTRTTEYLCMIELAMLVIDLVTSAIFLTGKALLINLAQSNHLPVRGEKSKSFSNKSHQNKIWNLTTRMRHKIKKILKLPINRLQPPQKRIWMCIQER